MRPLALATCQRLPRSCPDDLHLLRAFEDAGWPAEPLPWDADVDWASYAGVLIRATWDYTTRVRDYLAWVGRLERQGVPLWNPASIVRWNHDKRYLLDLERRGVPGVPTVLAERGADLVGLLAKAGWDDAVLKAVVSAGGFQTARVRAADPGAQAVLDGLPGEGPVLVQPFVREVVEEGEWSFVFVEGALSHALVKRARLGEFRVQEVHGGSLARAEPTPAQAAQARAVLEALGEPLLYARVDGVFVQGSFRLLELEVIEPELFFRLEPRAAPRLVAAVRARLG